MIPRYSLPKMKAIWDPHNRFQAWLDVEIAVAEGLAEYGYIPKDAPEKIRAGAKFTVERILEIEETTQHDVMAFVKCVTENLGEEGKYVHYGVTSYDIVDTALSMLMKQAADIIIEDLGRLGEVVAAQAREHKYTLMIGRTHGIHAEPITFGLKLASWYSEMRRNRARLERAREAVSCGKIAGAVGTFSFVDPFVEGHVCKKLGLSPAPVSSQIIQRDRHAEFFSTLAIIASSIDKFAQEIRLLQRTEVREAEEYFSQGQKGSSAMPHKRNPVLSENLSGLSRLVRSYALAALEDVALWHERDISHSSVERVIAPDATIVLDFMLGRFTGLMDKLVVYPERMLANLNMTHGVIFSQMVLLALIEKGAAREDAYAVVQKNAMKSWHEGIEFRKLLDQDERVRKLLTAAELDAIFDVNHFLKHLDFIFQRVFGK